MGKIDFVILSFANKKYGLGHYSRSKYIYNSIKKKTKVYFLNNRKKNTFLRFNSKIYDQDLLKIISRSKNVCLLIDLPTELFNNKFNKILKKYDFFKRISGKISIIIIDNYKIDLANINLAWIPSFYIINKYKKNKKIVYGWDKFILPKKNIKVKKNISKNLNLLINAGGSDIFKIGNILPKKIEENIKIKLNITWLVGPFANLPKIPNETFHSWKIIISPKKINSIISKSDIGFCIYGVTFFELLNQSIPTSVLCKTTKDNKEEINQLKNQNVALVSKNIIDSVTNISILVNSDSIRKYYEHKMKNIFKTDGIKQLYDYVNKKL
tara:strand:- start:401 stop:1375 length:975 start_codon:yes stop_codon:yes gene_type:complete